MLSPKCVSISLISIGVCNELIIFRSIGHWKSVFCQSISRNIYGNLKQLGTLLCGGLELPWYQFLQYMVNIALS
jgi:hypothetical protein